MAHFVHKVDQLGYINGINWKVGSRVEFYSDILGRSVVIEPGEISDFASIPRLLWNAYPPTKYANESLPHDRLYTDQSCTRLEADKVFLEALTCTGVPALRRHAFYWALRLFGWKAWADHRDKNLMTEKQLRRDAYDQIYGQKPDSKKN